MKRREQFLSYGSQWIDEEDIEAVIEILKSPFLTQGPKIEQFESAVADYVGAKFAVAFTNGTAALHGACHVAGIGQEDEVITTPITFAATSNAVLYCKGTPVFADIDPRTYNIDPHEIRKKITANTKAIMPVDFSGQPADLDEIMSIAEEYNLIVIEDGAHSLGAYYKGEKVGAQAHMTMFSFHPVKPITTAEGGIITTNSRDFYEKLKQFRSHGIEKTPYSIAQGDWYYEMTDLGYNYRMTDMQAALGLSQLMKLDDFLHKRRKIVQKYNEALFEIPGLILPMQLAETESGWHLYMIQLDHKIIRKPRKQIFEEMRALNIGVHVHYIPVYWHPYYQKMGYKKGACPIAENFYQQALTLPMFPKMTDRDVQDVIEALKNVIS
ncbi:UDP-4-amino-4,6-dideoxy-N-acetyl-beta-L-altrosamine transaminase [Robertmurraya massiliosenegalensis]|uniref:UDP-4-amino-4, 6-dideoxy-N-acetyl-beta-L-altrosamine transaminase n=1 Tax=Robertmurraya massiliosenegalensis TaxID=1287657 RepID=UPI0002F1B1D9|nr:UDP-4-amino-4,6-dideoxy-N-acetyl-beta-L-altrosamine transaminase [Robertmurraya massiliosenegalensis]